MLAKPDQRINSQKEIGSDKDDNVEMNDGEDTNKQNSKRFYTKQGSRTAQKRRFQCYVERRLSEMQL